MGNNGTAIASGTTRFILVPTDTIDTSELQVSQEWVNLPSWAGDYYRGVQVEPDEGWVKIWGYCTHEQLKHRARYLELWGALLEHLCPILTVMFNSLRLNRA